MTCVPLTGTAPDLAEEGAGENIYRMRVFGRKNRGWDVDVVTL